MHTKKELDLRLQAAGIHPLKRLGQNFLVNPKISSQVVAAVEILKPNTVVEIGPGMGALTDELVKGPWKTLLVEVDGGIVKHWQTMNSKAAIIHGDALKLRWEKIDLAEPSVIVSNLPYSIAGSLVVEMSSRYFGKFAHMVLMFQKEVAERIEAQFSSADYGMLSVMAQAHWKVSRVVDAGPQDFFPVPHVGSRVLRFDARIIDWNQEKFLGFVKNAFSHRRKKLVSNLASMNPKESVLKAFSQMELGEGCRAQELSPQRFVQLFKLLS